MLYCTLSLFMMACHRNDVTDREQPIRVAMLARAVFPLHGFGGIERHVFHLTTHLTSLGVDVTLYVQPPTNAPNSSPVVGRDTIAAHSSVVQRDLMRLQYLRYDYTSPILRPNSILGRQINYPWYSWQLGRAAAAAVRRGTYDVIHAQGLCAFGYGWIRQRDQQVRRTPFLANPHGLEEYRTPDWRKWLAYAPFRALYSYGTRCADRAIATDECTKDDLPQYLHVDPAKEVVIPSAIDADECLAFVQDDLRPTLRKQVRIDDADLVMMSVGRLERNKGYHVMIEALALLRDRLPPRWRWLLVGQGKEREALETLARERGLGEHAVFVGRLDDNELHTLYEDIDLVVHPTLYEGSSLVTLEGMIHRKPVVASAAGGIPDKVFDGRNGYLVRPGDANDLAAKIALALDRRADWPAWGDESVRIVRSTFHWPVVAQRTKNEYERLLGRT